MSKNVLHITLSMDGGGIENLIVNFAQSVDRDSFNVSVVCLDYGGNLIEELQAAGVQSIVTGRRPGIDWRLILKLSKLFSKYNADIIHTHNQAAHFYACIAAKFARIPIVITTEHSRHNTQGRLLRRLEKRFLYAITDKWIVVSEELKEKSIDRDGLPAKKIQIINNGVNFAKFPSQNDSLATLKSDLINNLGLPPDAKIVIMVARLHPIKDHALFIDAFNLIQQSHPNVHALLVGEGECHKSLVRQSRSLGLGGKIHFLGYRNDISELLCISDIFVLCSKTEGLPVSLLEACASQTPVLITDSSNRAELIEDQITGTVVKNDPEDLSNGMKEILNNHRNSKLMAAMVAKKVLTAYSLTTMVKQYEQTYLCLLRNKGSQTSSP